MSRNLKFTESQLNELCQNPYTHNATPYKIQFTYEFKEMFVTRWEAGTKPRDILREAGYNPEWFTRKNIYAIQARIMAEYRSVDGLKHPRGKSSAEKIAAFEKKNLSKIATDAAIKELQDEIVHLQRQVEFLKKTASIRKKYQTRDR